MTHYRCTCGHPDHAHDTGRGHTPGRCRACLERGDAGYPSQECQRFQWDGRPPVETPP